MDSQKFCLKWDGFQSSVTSVFDVLRVDSELVDVTLCCEGQRVRAHRMMLSACSPYFRELFKDLPNQHLAVFLKDTSAADLNAIVEFMYKGSVNVSQSQLASFIKTAEMLQVRGLSGDDDKASPPSRHSSGHRQTAPPSRQMTPSSPVPRRPPETALHPPPPLPPPPPPPSVTPLQSQHGQHSQGQHGHQSQSQQTGQQGQKQEPSSPPAKRRRASEPNALSDQPLSSPSAAGGGGSGGSSGSTASSASATTSAAAAAGVAAASPRPASLPSAAASATADGAMPSPGDAYQHPHQQHQNQHQQHDNYHHGDHDEDSNRLSHEESAYGDEMSDNHDDSMPLGGVKMEKIEQVDDDVVLDDTLDHVAELERYAAEDRTTAAAARGYMQHLQTRQRLTSMSAAAAAAAAVQMGAMQAGPSQRLSEDGSSQGSGAARFACSVCGQCYTNPDSRQMHMKKHSGETTCPVCGKVYSMVHNLRRHMRTAHDMHRGGAMQGHMLP